jgi:hypothetical protein
MLSRVDLPEPEGPMMAKSVPLMMLAETLVRITFIVFEPKHLSFTCSYCCTRTVQFEKSKYVRVFAFLHFLPC